MNSAPSPRAVAKIGKRVFTASSATRDFEKPLAANCETSVSNIFFLNALEAFPKSNGNAFPFSAAANGAKHADALVSFQTKASAGVRIAKDASAVGAAERAAAAHAAPARASSTGKRASRSAGASQCQSLARRSDPSAKRFVS